MALILLLVSVMITVSGCSHLEAPLDGSFYSAKNSLYIAVRGDIASPGALAAKAKVVDLFSREFPGAKLTSMTVYPGLLGP
jgi:hypothetical protein